MKTNQEMGLISDREGHYDMDGVSFEHLKNSLGSLDEIERSADSISVQMEHQEAPPEDGVPDLENYQVSSAKNHSQYEEYLEFEKAGD